MASIAIDRPIISIPPSRAGVGSGGSRPGTASPSNTPGSASTPEGQVLVMKFGSSVFSHERDVWAIVSEIDRQVRAGRRVVAVVSALLGHTDRLLAQARRITDAPSGPAVASLLATGEQASASLLSLALGQVGVAHAHLDARSIRLVASGPHLDATPVTFDPAPIFRSLERVPVVVFPGFEAINEYNEPVVLGRGGSDLSAVFLAAGLKAEVRLVKDVDGVFERDPLACPAGREPRRFEQIRWEQVPAIASKLVQTRAVLLAAERRLNIRVCALGSDSGTLIGPITELGEPFRRRGVDDPARQPVPPAALV